MKLLEREIGSVDYAANQTRTLPLPRNYAYDRLMLKLVANLTRAATAADGGGPKDSPPAQLVRELQIIANGRDVIKRIDLETLHRLCQQRHGTRPYISSADWAGYANAATKTLIVCAWLDFAMWRAIKPIDSLLNSAGLATLDLIVTWGAGIDTMNDTWPGTGTAPVVTVNSATLYVASQEHVGVAPGTRFMANKELMHRSQITAASTKHQIRLPVGNLYRSFVLKTHSDGDQVDTILNSITLQSGTEVFKYRLAGFLQADNRLACEVEMPERTAAAAAVNHALLEHVMTGYYLLEFVIDGRLTECLDTAQLSGLDLFLDVNHPGTNDFVDVYPVELIAPPKEAAA